MGVLFNKKLKEPYRLTLWAEKGEKEVFYDEARKRGRMPSELMRELMNQKLEEWAREDAAHMKNTA